MQPTKPTQTNLITGATGHIGNVLARELLKRGQAVRALVLPGECCTPLDDLPVERTPGDVLDLPALCQAMQGVERVYHLAGLISILPGKNNRVRKVNVQGTRNVLRAAHEAGVPRLVYTSSIHALYRAPHGTLIDENIPFDPEHAISAYDQSKAEASLLVQDAACLGLDAVIACPTGVIGPYDFRRSEMGCLILDAMQKRPQLYVDGAYDFVDVRDVAQGLVLAGERGRRGESYILSGEQISVRRILRLVQDALGERRALLKVPLGLARLAAIFAPLYYRLARIRPRLTPYALATLASNSVISNAKARGELGYNPRPLSETIADTVRWFREPLRYAAQLAR
ncbi:MAG: SDR family oxidoreductase [Chloroflexota bacterium]